MNLLAAPLRRDLHYVSTLIGGIFASAIGRGIKNHHKRFRIFVMDFVISPLVLKLPVLMRTAPIF